MTGFDGLSAEVIVAVAAAILVIVCWRAYRRTDNIGFLLIGIALGVIPSVGSVVDGPLVSWFSDSFFDGRSYQSALRLYLAVNLTLQAGLLSSALLSLASAKLRSSDCRLDLPVDDRDEPACSEA